MKAARLAWFERQVDLDPDRLVFLDGTATNTKMARRYGRAPRGERCRIAVPFGHWNLITVTAGLRANGLMATARRVSTAECRDDLAAAGDDACDPT